MTQKVLQLCTAEWMNVLGIPKVYQGPVLGTQLALAHCKQQRFKIGSDFNQFLSSIFKMEFSSRKDGKKEIC
jgi:hypothetical protein